MKPITSKNGLWTVNGIIGRGENPPPVAGCFKGLAVVMGSGRGVWEDIFHFNPEKKKAAVVAVNNMALHWKDKVDHACSLHREEPNLWRKLRPAYFCQPCKILTHAHLAGGQTAETDFTWWIERGGGGTSGLFGAMLALALGYDRIVLAGIPLDDSGHFYDPPWVRSGGLKSDFIRSEWRAAQEEYFQGRVRSLSGWTKEILGSPDEKWLHS